MLFGLVNSVVIGLLSMFVSCLIGWFLCCVGFLLVGLILGVCVYAL